MEMNRKQFAKEYRRWLQEYSWSLSARLRFAPGTNRSRRENLFGDWISELRREESAPDFHWVSVAENRFLKTRPELQVLIGGLRNRSKYWASRWNQLGGKAVIERFDREQHETFFLATVEKMGVEDTMEIESDFRQEEAFRDSSTKGLQEADQESRKLRIENVSEDMTLGSLRYRFEKFGRVEEISIQSGPTLFGRNFVYALVQMPVEDARRAMRASIASQWDGKLLDVMWADRRQGPWFSPGWRPPM